VGASLSKWEASLDARHSAALGSACSLTSDSVSKTLCESEIPLTDVAIKTTGF